MQVLNTTMSQTLISTVKRILVLCVFIFISACQGGSISDGLESAKAPEPAQTTQNTINQPTTPADPNAPTQSAALPATKAVVFLPVSNAPQTAVTSLASSIRDAAASNQVRLVNSVQDGASYQVKGYFSALEDGAGTLLVYVWDVLDQNNKRVFRISGQERSSSKSADPWSSVSSGMIDRVAKSSLGQLKSWLASRG